MPNRLVKTFTFKDLTDDEKDEVSGIREYFATTALDLDELLPENAEKTTALRKLREAKDCAVLSIIYKD